MMSDFQVTPIEERYKNLQSDVKEYVLGLAEVYNILNKEDPDQVTRDNLTEERVQTIDTIDDQKNER